MKNTYIAPALTIVPVKVEHGYARSISPLAVEGDHSTRQTDKRNISTNWVKGYDEGFWGEEGYGEDQ